MSVVLEPYFWDEQAAHAKLEEIVWPNGPVCRRCGAIDRIGAVTGKGARAGLKFCCRCRKQFRATIGTMFEGSHVPLHKWFQACFLLNAARGAVTAHQLHRRLEVTYKTALGIVGRLAAVIASAGGNPLAGGLDGPSQTSTLGRRQRALWQGPAWAAGDVGWDELPWLKFPRQPTRQFLRFADTVRQLGCTEDEVGFERLLAALGAPAAKCASDIQDRPSSVPRMGRFAGPADRDLEQELPVGARAPHPESAPRAASDLSPQAGRGGWPLGEGLRWNQSARGRLSGTISSAARPR